MTLFLGVNHAFDLVLPKKSLAAHNAIYDVERFLAMQLKTFEEPIIAEEKNEYQLT